MGLVFDLLSLEEHFYESIFGSSYTLACSICTYCLSFMGTLSHWSRVNSENGERFKVSSRHSDAWPCIWTVMRSLITDRESKHSLNLPKSSVFPGSFSLACRISRRNPPSSPHSSTQTRQQKLPPQQHHSSTTPTIEA
jgi:hypothetical protein